MDRRRIGLLLALAGLLGLAFAFSTNPPPGSFEQWACCERSPDSWLLAARGPAIARYDEANDTTFALFECSHGYCPFAARIRGDARDNVAQGTVLLFSRYRPTPGGIGPMSFSIETPDGLQRSMVVTNATIEPMDIASPWFHLGVYGGAFLLVALGGALAWGADAWDLGMASAGIVIGLAWGLFLVRAPELIVGPFLALVLGGLGLATALGGRRWARARHAAFALLFAAAALFFALATFDAYVAYDPTM